MRTTRTAHRSARSRGFTLLELMVSLTIGGLAISAMYTIGANLVRQYHQQQQAANSMTTLRVALNQVKRDIARAGFMATPNLVPPAPFVSPGCAINYAQHAPAISGSLAGISRFTANVCATDATCSNVHAGITNNITNGFTVDNLVMFGNYETSSEYPYLQLVSPNTVSVGRSSHAYQTDFTQWWQGNTAAPDTDAFRRAFAPGRMIRIRTTSGLQHYATIVNGGVTDEGANDARVTFDVAVPPGCAAGTKNGSIAPISAIRYYARNDPDPPTPNPWGPMAQLVREEVQGNDKVTPLALTEPTNNAYTYTNTRVVLDYVVSFNLGFVVNTNTDPTVLTDRIAPGTDTATATFVNTSPERVRAVTIQLSARTPDDDRALSPGNCANLRCFQVIANRPAAARVRTLRAEVFLPNIAFESY